MFGYTLVQTLWVLLDFRKLKTLSPSGLYFDWSNIASGWTHRRRKEEDAAKGLKFLSGRGVRVRPSPPKKSGQAFLNLLVVLHCTSAPRG